MILVERGEGVETKPIKTSYSPTAGTAYITFDNVKVPVENTLGQEGGGVFVILRYVFHIESRMDKLTSMQQLQPRTMGNVHRQRPNATSCS